MSLNELSSICLSKINLQSEIIVLIAKWISKSTLKSFARFLKNSSQLKSFSHIHSLCQLILCPHYCVSFSDATESQPEMTNIFPVAYFLNCGCIFIPSLLLARKKESFRSHSEGLRASSRLSVTKGLRRPNRNGYVADSGGCIHDWNFLHSRYLQRLD